MKYFVLYTQNTVSPVDLYAYHGALGRKIKNEDAWHNRDLESSKSIHRYPLVQYKILQHHLAIVTLEPESNNLFQLAAQLPMVLWINDRPVQLRFHKLMSYGGNMRLQSKLLAYRCNNWMPMNSIDYQAYKALCIQLDVPFNQPEISHPELLRFFESLLSRQLKRQIESLGYKKESTELEINLLSNKLQHCRTNYYNDNQVSMIKNLNISMNLAWPTHLGIGKGTAIGYGMFQKIRHN